MMKSKWLFVILGLGVCVGLLVAACRGRGPGLVLK